MEMVGQEAPAEVQSAGQQEAIPTLHRVTAEAMGEMVVTDGATKKADKGKAPQQELLVIAMGSCLRAAEEAHVLVTTPLAALVAEHRADFAMAFLQTQWLTWAVVEAQAVTAEIIRVILVLAAAASSSFATTDRGKLNVNYALIENGIVTNIIWLYPNNASDFPNAVPCEDYPVGIGDTYTDGVFYREGEKLPTPAEAALADQTDMQEALNILGVEING